MKIFLVGGAVRDKLLNIPVEDKDYLVVGSSPQEMINNGFKPIGKDFPVFLHPETKFEYALARTEKKVGSGHKGFVFYTSPNVTIEQDLGRRDITINAIAVDEDNNYIDPFEGIKDLNSKIIRHVSNAFQEDPLRVLRVARFQAKLDSFSIHDDTYLLMKKIVDSGEIQNLSCERIMAELYKGFRENNSIKMLEVLNNCEALDIIFPNLVFEKHNKKIKKVLDLSQDLCNSSPKRRLLLFLLSSNFNKNKIDPTIYDNIKNISLPSSEKKIISLIEKYIFELINFVNLKQKNRLDCLYGFDFFRRPELIYESIEIIRLILESNEIDLEPIKLTKKLIIKFQKLLSNSNNIIDSNLSGEEIKKSVYKERLTLLSNLR